MDVFFSPQYVKRPYEVVGEIRAEGGDIVSYESMQQKLVQEAMQKGADVIMIEKLDMTETGYTTVGHKTGERRKGVARPRSGAPSDDVRRHLWVDTTGCSAGHLRTVIDLRGTDRVLSGTDGGPVPISRSRIE